MEDVSLGGLVPLGFFREFKSGRSNNDSIRDFVSSEPSRHKAIILSYLRLGDRMGWTMEKSPDVIDGTHQPDSASPVTDGHWVWRADLAHYVEKYNLRLPQEFIDTVVARNGIPPEITPDEHRRIARAWYQLPPNEATP